MRATLLLARRHGVAVGAHPGFPDREGFGRTITTRDPAAIEALLLPQLTAMVEVAASEGATIAHVKPHGALYNLSAQDRAVADAVAAAVRRVVPGAALVGLAGSHSLPAAAAAGLRALAEGFADRGYLADGSLAPRAQPGAVIADPDVAAERAVRLVTEGRITTLDGGELALAIDTLCLHGDTKGAARLARRVRQRLVESDVELRAPGSA
jgi:UPF0271 protein